MTVNVPLPTEDSATFAAVTHEILQLIRAEVGAVDLSADSDLLSLGLDSLKVMQLVFKLEVRYDINIDEDYADDLTTIGDLAGLIVRLVREQA
jgi:acyl carrier protein